MRTSNFWYKHILCYYLSLCIVDLSCLLTSHAIITDVTTVISNQVFLALHELQAYDASVVPTVDAVIQKAGMKLGNIKPRAAFLGLASAKLSCEEVLFISEISWQFS